MKDEALNSTLFRARFEGCRRAVRQTTEWMMNDLEEHNAAILDCFIQTEVYEK
jgi:hypothetical protein